MADNKQTSHHAEPHKVREATRNAAFEAHLATEAIENPDSEKTDLRKDKEAVRAIEEAVDVLEQAVGEPTTNNHTTRKILHEEERALVAEQKAVHRADKGYTAMQDHASIIAEQLSADAAEIAEQAGEKQREYLNYEFGKDDETVW